MTPEATTAVAPRGPATVHALRGKTLTPDQVELLKRTICRGASNDELQLFLYVCEHTGLDPFLHQIHAVKRRDMVDGAWVDRMTVQVGIDGLRLVAERTGNYAPGPEPVFEYDDEDGQLVKATAYVLKFHERSNTWHTIPGVAHYDEYAQLRPIYEGKGASRQKVGDEPNRMWKEKPHIMLAKCAEALALRKGFPNETSGLYIDEEMPSDTGGKGRAPIKEPEAKKGADATPMPTGPVIIEKQRRALFAAGNDAGHSGDDIRDYLKARYNVASSRHVPADQFQKAMDRMHNMQPLFVEVEGQRVPHDPHDEAFKRALPPPAPEGDDLPPEPGSDG